MIDAVCARAGGDAARIGLLGFSMGAAVVLQTAAIEPRVKCVIAESGFSDLDAVSYDFLERHLGVRWKVIHDMSMRVAERKAHFTIRTVSPVDAVKRLTQPVLFIHGSEDRTINVRYAHELYDSCTALKQLYIVSGAHHKDLHDSAGDAYDAKRIDFLNRYL